MKYRLRYILKLSIRTFMAFIMSTLVILSSSPISHALSAHNLSDILNGWAYYDSSTTTSCTTSTVTSTPTAAPGVSVAGNKVFYIGDSLTYHLTQGNFDHTITGNLLEKTAAAGYSVDTATHLISTGKQDNSPRVNGHSLEAQGGINIANSITHLSEHGLGGSVTDFDKDHADIVVIALGTNNESPESDLSNQIDAIINTIRTNNNPAIYWVNGYWPTSDKKTQFTDVNQVIATAAAKDNFHVIDYATAAAATPLIAPDPKSPTADGVHVGTQSGRQAKADWIVAQLPKPGAQVSTGTPPTPGPGCCSVSTPGSGGTATPGVGATGPTLGDVSIDGNPYHVLTYPPGITDEVKAAKAIDDYITANAPSSPFIGLGKDFIASGKKFNVNPFLAAGHLSVENGFATATGGWAVTTPPSYNAFGRSGSQSQPHTIYHGSKGDRIVYQWLSWEDSLIGQDNWFAYIRRNYLTPGSPYASPDLTVYLSHYAPNSDGNNETAYAHKVKVVIDALVATSSSVAVTTATAGSPSTGGCTSGTTAPAAVSTPSKGDASKYIPDCGANEGNAAIACTAINQLSNIPYPESKKSESTAGPTVTTPSLLDCSGLTNMAVYRTFGVKLQLCSVGYLSDKNFIRLDGQSGRPDIHDIKAGDFVGIGTACTSAGGTGHVAVVVSYDKTTKKLITMEASSPTWLSGLRGTGGTNTYNVGLKDDGGKGTFEWGVRYVGDKTIQPGAL